MIKVLGLDPSQRNLGMVKALVCPDSFKVLIADMHLVHTEVGGNLKQVRKSSDHLRRANEQAIKLREWENWADIVMSEIPHGSQNASSMFSYGVCIGLLAWISKPLIQVQADETKKIATGRKTASKEEMIAWAAGLYPHAPWLRDRGKADGRIIDANQHTADAIGVTHAGIQTQAFRAATAMLRSLKEAA